MQNFLFLTKHKIFAGVVIVAIFSGSYFIYQHLSGNNSSVSYVLAKVQKGTLVVSVSGSGQVSTQNQIDIKPKISGDVAYVGASNGEYIEAGRIIAQINAKDAEKAVRDAEINLESAKLNLEKLKQSSADIGKIKEDSFNAVSNAFLDLPTVVSGSDTIINGRTLADSQGNQGFYTDFVYLPDREKIAPFVQSALNDYAVARSQYNQTLLLYQNTNRYTDSNGITDLLEQTANTTKAIAQALKSEQSLLDYLKDYSANHPEKILPNTVITYRSNLQTYIGQVNGHLSDLINAQNSVRNAPLDISSQALTIKQRENALLDAQNNLADYSVRAPFNGIVAAVNVKKGESVLPGTAISTIITYQKLAEVSLNEVDVAKVKVGQKATLIFDAIPGLSISGQVIEIDTIGVVSQGVVTYTVKIAFDTQDERVKPAMSVTGAIITEAKPDVLLVPNSAVKQESGSSFVEIPNQEDLSVAVQASAGGIILKNPLDRKQVETGLSNDDSTEIISGLKEGDEIITRATQSSAKSASAQQSSSGLRIPGLTGGGGGGARSGALGR